MKCPTCSSEDFYIKDADDEYDLYEFSCNNGKITFEDDIKESDVPQINDSSEVYCNKCVWHGKLEKLK